MDKIENFRTYIGDGVYAEVENGMVLLTTSNGVCVTNRIYLEPDTMKNFSEWLAKVGNA